MENDFERYLRETGLLDNLTKSLVLCLEDSLSPEQSLQTIVDNICLVSVSRMLNENAELKQNIETEKKMIKFLQDSLELK